LFILFEIPENHDMKKETYDLIPILRGSGIQLINAERERQIYEEGWSPDHDDTHKKGEMAYAAACYTYDYAEETRYGDPGTPRQISPQAWPWDEISWKPKDRMSRLVRAGALIAAEIDRLSRMNAEAMASADTQTPTTPTNGQ
jgi:hypothetical protein